MRKFWRWITGADLKDFTFRHERGPKHTVRARSLAEAKDKMREFLQIQMFGAFALFYDPAAVERELNKCRLVIEGDDER